MCFTGWCPHEKYSYAREDCICKKPKNWPCPMEMSEEEYDDYNEEYEPDEDERLNWISQDFSYHKDN